VHIAFCRNSADPWSVTATRRYLVVLILLSTIFGSKGIILGMETIFGQRKRESCKLNGKSEL